MTKTKRILAIALSGVILLPSITMAEAGQRNGWRDHRGGHHRDHRPNRGHHQKKKHNNDVGIAVAAGVIGLAAGAILLGATSGPSRAAPPRTYYPPAPAGGYYPPAPHRGTIHGAGYGAQPWSPAWYRYCTNKFRSFNPNTGTYTTYSGVQKFCQ
ncbi:BA14K family protein [Roseibium algae]|uniref:Lectin-like protein BA14k n=1 Tax=Roseibium algae TaxID=3123038 RepID=A0ABU8TM40_9HYPH